MSNLSTWVDWEDIPVSANWWEEIKNGIALANNFIIIMSPASMSATMCHIELEHAFDLKKRVIPILYMDYQHNDCLQKLVERQSSNLASNTLLINRDVVNLFEENIRNLEILNYFYFRPNDDFNAKISSLIDVIQTDYVYKSTHTQFALRAHEWGNYNRDESFLLTGKALQDAERWLSEAFSKQKSPSPTELQVVYIKASRIVEDERQQELQNARNPLRAITSRFTRSYGNPSQTELTNRLKTMRLMAVYQLMKEDL